MARLKLSAFALTLGLTAAANAAPDFAKLRQAEKVAISLTGKPLTPDLRTKFLNDQITLEQLADQLSSSGDFIQHFAAFWTRLLGMQSPINVYGINVVGKGDFNGTQGRTNFGNLTDGSITDKDAKYLQDWINGRKTAAPELRILEHCPDAPIIVWNDSQDRLNYVKKAAETGMGYSQTEKKDVPIVAGTADLWKQVLTMIQASSTELKTCTDSSLVDVKPWWDPEKVTNKAKYTRVNAMAYKTTPDLKIRCGDTLEKCNMKEAPSYDRYIDEVGFDMSMEPGYIIGHTVAEDKPFTNVITTPSTIMTGTYGYFMNKDGTDFWGNFPGKGIVDIQNPIFTSPKVKDRSRHWINRSPAHAGVLTTPAFQMLTNGNRAKANRTYEVFLCKVFTVPDGAKADPNASDPDLTQRPYCSYCHKSLEPMAAFFNRWPAVGNTDYRFNNDKPTDLAIDKGRFNGFEGNGAAAFGKIVSESETFDECSVRRAFEFLNGRKMSAIEIENLLPGYVGELRSNQKNLRTIIKAMTLRPEFLLPKGGE